MEAVSSVTENSISSGSAQEHKTGHRMAIIIIKTEKYLFDNSVSPLKKSVVASLSCRSFALSVSGKVADEKKYKYGYEDNCAEGVHIRSNTLFGL